MSNINISIPKGTRDFLPSQMMSRNYVFAVIRSAFERFGFVPIETPSMENLSTLMGKYGEEGDRLLFKILNSGNFLQNIDFTETNQNKIASQLCEKGLRYDLTVPFARFVVQHYNELTFPFKRYQIQTVWRADRPQKGRYREFYQCDADIIGSDSLLNEWELMQLIDDVFSALKLNVCLKMNNRKILAGIAQMANCSDKLSEITVAIDKLDKIGLENVCKELKERQIEQQSIDKLLPILTLGGTNEEKIAKLKKNLPNSDIGYKGIEEMEEIFKYAQSVDFKLNMDIQLDLSLARGLNYYTGAIFEVVSKDVQIGSITGGGRYDNLTGIFGLQNMSGVGISFGIERIFDVMQQIHPQINSVENQSLAMFVNFGKKETVYCLNALKKMREEGINAEIYPDSAKMQKQFKYADSKGIPFVIIAGENEIKESLFALKNMQSGEQNILNLEEIINQIKNIKQ
ncbi:MAG: histidine--tRNA ligase [Bacteroidales bacterium]|jgi:histidyl-tRNA synthetase|nr:histidine--tRNA ligase [Bacteroidales bacterium]